MNKPYGKITLLLKARKDAIGYNPKELARILLRDDLEFYISQVDTGNTNNGWNFTTLRIYSKERNVVDIEDV